MQIFMNKSSLIVDNVCIRVYKQNTLYVLLDNDCSIRVYQSFVAILQKIIPIMLALCLMLSVTYYAQNCTGIIGWSLIVMHSL